MLGWSSYKHKNKPRAIYFNICKSDDQSGRIHEKTGSAAKYIITFVRRCVSLLVGSFNKSIARSVSKIHLSLTVSRQSNTPQRSASALNASFSHTGISIIYKPNETYLSICFQTQTLRNISKMHSRLNSQGEILIQRKQLFKMFLFCKYIFTVLWRLWLTLHFTERVCSPDPSVSGQSGKQIVQIS